ncbi:hypothetical protein HN51_032074 [Arachis hypogaea]|uniref:WRKY domain-containing protein n=2 Tax=Arachis TaxID=3817 RepID=A0A445B5X0_ARAHY|nr:WRKY DNA-binding transcription factor 70 [Arachis duranensis]XP_025623389.1 WRKY DNA-binding transcription factor 70 [Arachis hypogaea]QHO16349.1 putative WRKY transcription factor [Arachis hypogaea]RYR34074.1 hypothetical protein Ahy_A10g048791 isoform A [Arachis hypogaea]
MSSIVSCGSEGNIGFSEKRERLMNKLVEGHKHATELKLLLQNQNQNPPATIHHGGGSSAEALLITKILRSFAETLSVLDSSSSSASFFLNENNSGSQLVIAADSTNNDLRSEEGSSESSKRFSSSVPKDRRGTYKRRKTEETWSNVSPTTEDNLAWRKYGQKDILNSKFPRSYYRCTRKHDQGCKATKQVQRIQDNPVLYQITYIGRHTCKETLKAPQMTAYLLNPQDHHQTPPTNAIIKQEYPKQEDTPSGEIIIAEKLDANLWSELKDIEITNPPTYANFGAFSYNFCTTGFHFDDHHHDESHML